MIQNEAIATEIQNMGSDPIAMAMGSDPNPFGTQTSVEPSHARLTARSAALFAM